MALELMSTTTFLTLALILAVVPKIWEACRILLWRPYVLSRSLKKQGVSGPGYKILYGNIREIRKMKSEAKTWVLDPNSHNILPRVLPHYHSWMSQYGETFIYWYGTEPRICISEPELVKQILSNKFGFYVKPNVRPEVNKLTGNGLVLVEGLDWIRHRRILNPAFSIDKLKVMTKPMADCTAKMFQRWKKQGTDQVSKIEMSSEFQRLTADIIATAAFGSSYAEGIEAFRSQRELQKCCVVSLSKAFVPGFQYLPTALNLQMWKLDRKVKNSLKKIIDTKLNSNSGYGEDLLGLMLTATKADGPDKKGLKMSMDEIMEE